MKEHVVAFVGNPNVGKSAWINALSDAGFKIGNWPGVSVERKEASVEWDGERFLLIDLPGCYSLEAIGNEEQITSDFLRESQVDLIVNVVDASNLARNLYLTLLLRELQIPMILIFNFMDVVKKCHIQIDFVKLSRRLQLPILGVSAFSSADALIVKQEIQRGIHTEGFYYPIFSNEDVEQYVALYNYIDDHMPCAITLQERELHALTLHTLAGKQEALSQLSSWQFDMQVILRLRGTINQSYLDQQRYVIIQSFMKYVIQEQEPHAITRKIDKILLHKYFALPIFFTIFTLLLLFVFQASAPLNEFIQYLIQDVIYKYVAVALSSLPRALQGVLLDGVLAGVGGVLTFIPLMALLYVMLSLLEESGYMSRIAFLLDRMMNVFHLSGKSFIALLLGFGCNVPAIYATRTLDQEKQKRFTALLVPFMSCGARLPVYVLFASAFFKGKAAIMIISVYGIGILLALILAMVLAKTKTFQEEGMFVMELPNYHLPKMSIVCHKVKEEVLAYVRKAVGIVLWAMVILWGISYFPNGSMETSYMASAAKVVAPIFEPAGFGDRWECVASLPGGIIAKETIVGYFQTVLQGTNEREEMTLDIKTDLVEIKDHFIDACKHSVLDTFAFHVHLKAGDEQQVSAVQTLWTDETAQLRAFCFMVYVLLSIPCMMTLQALYREYGWRLALLSIAIMSILPYVAAVVIFQVCTLFI